MKEAAIIVKGVIGVGLVLTILAPVSDGYPTYSQNGDATYCGACHGDFLDNAYISPSDGQNWGNLHNLHRFDMLNGDCVTCHFTPGSFPVETGSSRGGAGFDPISCVGCHGRDEDMGHDSQSPGRGAGLRQHHVNAGVTLCMMCHADADPADYTPVGEDVPPAYYFTPDANHPDKPTDPCNPNGEEDYAGLLEGLDNDGDNVYDGADLDCVALPGDCDGDGDVGLTDLANLDTCLLGPDGGLGVGCECLDLNANGDVDLADFREFQLVFTGDL